MPRKTKTYRRVWLSPKDIDEESYASYWCDVTGDTYGSGYVDAGLRVGDCTRRIQLDFGFSGEKGKSARLDKLRALRDAITDLEYRIEQS